MSKFDRIPPKCTVDYLGVMPVADAQKLQELTPAPKFITYRRLEPRLKFDRGECRIIESKHAHVYKYTPIQKSAIDI